MLIEENKGAYHESMTSPKPHKNWSIMHWIWTLCREFSLIKYPAAIFVACKNTQPVQIVHSSLWDENPTMVILLLSKKYNKIFPHKFFFWVRYYHCYLFYSMVIGIEGGGDGVGTT